MHYRTFLFIFLLLLYFRICVATYPESAKNEDLEEARKKKKKGAYLFPLLFGTLMIKAIIFPLAFKAMAVMSSIAVLLSTMSLIISSIVGYVKVAMKSSDSTVRIVQRHPQWSKDDENSTKNYYILEPSDYISNIASNKENYLNKYV